MESLCCPKHPVGSACYPPDLLLWVALIFSLLLALYLLEYSVARVTQQEPSFLFSSIYLGLLHITITTVLPLCTVTNSVLNKSHGPYS